MGGWSGWCLAHVALWTWLVHTFGCLLAMLKGGRSGSSCPAPLPSQGTWSCTRWCMSASSVIVSSLTCKGVQVGPTQPRKATPCARARDHPPRPDPPVPLRFCG